MATISAMVHTVSVSREGEVRLERVDVAHDTGFGLVNPLSVKKQIECQITWFYNDAMHQASTIAGGRIASSASAICVASSITSSSFIGFAATRRDSVSPSNSSMAMNGRPSCSPMSWIVQM